MKCPRCNSIWGHTQHCPIAVMRQLQGLLCPPDKLQVQVTFTRPVQPLHKGDSK